MIAWKVYMWLKVSYCVVFVSWYVNSSGGDQFSSYNVHISNRKVFFWRSELFLKISTRIDRKKTKLTVTVRHGTGTVILTYADQTEYSNHSNGWVVYRMSESKLTFNILTGPFWKEAPSRNWWRWRRLNQPMTRTRTTEITKKK